MSGRKGDGAGFEAMRRVAVEVRAASDEQAKLTGKAKIALDERGIVVGVKDLQGVKASLRQRRNRWFVAKFTGMRERCHATGLVDDRDDGVGRSAGARDERGAAGAKPAIERFLRVRDISGVHQCTRDEWTANRSAAVCRRPREHGPEIDRHTERRQAIPDRPRPREPCVSLLGKEPVEGVVPRIEEITEHVHVSPLVERRDLDAGDGLEASRSSQPAHLVNRGGRIVIGDRERRQSGGCRTVDQLCRRTAAVGRSRMQVKINQSGMCQVPKTKFQNPK